ALPGSSARRDRQPGRNDARAGHASEVCVHPCAALQPFLPPIPNHLRRGSGAADLLHSHRRSRTRVAGEGARSDGHSNTPANVIMDAPTFTDILDANITRETLKRILT